MSRSKEDILKDGAKTRFSGSNQPKNKRTSTKILTEMLIKDLSSKRDIIIEGFDVLTGEKRKIRVPIPTKDIITRALLTKAAKGDIYAIKEVFDRVEGKAQQNIVAELQGQFVIEDEPTIDYSKLSDGALRELTELANRPSEGESGIM